MRSGHSITHWNRPHHQCRGLCRDHYNSCKVCPLPELDMCGTWSYSWRSMEAIFPCESPPVFDGQCSLQDVACTFSPAVTHDFAPPCGFDSIQPFAFGKNLIKLTRPGNSSRFVHVQPQSFPALTECLRCMRGRPTRGLTALTQCNHVKINPEMLSLS